MVCIALSLNYANLYGYIKCKFGQNSDNSTLGSNITSFTSDFIKKQLFQNVSYFLKIISYYLIEYFNIVNVFIIL